MLLHKQQRRISYELNEFSSKIMLLKTFVALCDHVTALIYLPHMWNMYSNELHTQKHGVDKIHLFAQHGLTESEKTYILKTWFLRNIRHSWINMSFIYGQYYKVDTNKDLEQLEWVLETINVQLMSRATCLMIK